MNQKTITTKGRTDAKGELEAVFSTFGVVDSQDDVVMASAFTDGQAVPLTWSHDWERPIGHGVVRVERDRAVFKGKLWLDTQDGLESFKKMKNNPGQEFSWGFTILEAEPGVHDGQPVRIITRTIVHEVSPVLVGAGVGTHVLAIKEGRRNSGSDLERIQHVHDLAGELGAGCGTAKRRSGAGRPHRPDPALVRIFERLEHARAAQDRTDRAELRVIFSRLDEQDAHERRLNAEAGVALVRALNTADRVCGRQAGGYRR